MRGRYLAATVAAVVAAVVVVGVVMTAVLGGGPSARPAGSLRPGETGVPLAVDAAACPLGAPNVSPTDGPSPSRAAFDDRGSMLLAESSGADPDEGAGRLRLCLDGAAPIDIGIGCRWSVDRSAVERIAGVVDRPGGGEVLVALQPASAGPGVLAIGISSTGDPVGQYRSVDPTRIGLASEPGIVAGVARFVDIPFVLDSGARAGAVPPADQPPTIAGSLRWSCGPAPAPQPGRAAGQLTVHLDRPVGTEVAVAAVCRWTAGPGAPSVASVDMAAPIDVAGGKSWAVTINGLGDPPLPSEPDVSIYLSTADRGDFYAAQAFGDVITANIAPAGRAGRLRFAGIALARETGLPTLDGTEATRTLSGIVAWSCDTPVAGPERLPAGIPPIVQPTTRPGIATLTIDGIVDGPLEIPISCQVHDNPADADGTQVDRVDGQFGVGDESVRLIADDGTLILFRTSPDGRILGEYASDPGMGPSLAGADQLPAGQRLTLRFRPIDSAYQPFGGDAGQREVGATVAIDCRDSNAPPEPVR